MVEVDLLTCINSGDCIAITKSAYYIMMGVYGLVGVLLILLFFIYMWTPGFTFLRAKFQKKRMMYVTERSQRGMFIPTTFVHDGVVKVPQVGPYILTERSHTIESKSGIPLYFGFGEFAASIPLFFPYVLEKLKSKNIDVSDWDDLDRIVNGWKKDSSWIDEAAKNMNVSKEDVIKELNKVQIHIRPYQTIKLHDMANMFPFNVTPAMVESLITFEKAKQMRFWQKININTAIVAIMVMVGASLALIIAWKFIGGQNPAPQEVKVVLDSAVQTANYTAQVVVNNITA